MAKRVLVTGASGLLGRELLKVFKAKGWQCLGLAYSRAGGELRKVDIRSREEVAGVLREFQPRVVVHAAAERRPDVVEKHADATQALNVTATQTLADLCSQDGVFLIYISTDYVFDGSSPPYKPRDSPSPINAYGRSKLEGEKVVLQHQDAAVLRVPVLYGAVESLEESAVTAIFKTVKGGVPAKLSDYERRYPTHTCDVAAMCCLMASSALEQQSSISGVWHFSAYECFTKYEMGVAMAEELGLASSHLIPIREPSAGAVRPYNCQLECSESDTMFPVKRTLFRAAIKQVLQPYM